MAFLGCAVQNSMPGKSIDLSIKDPEDDEAARDAPAEETAAQKVAEMVAAPAQVPELVVIEFKVGDKVSARWKGGNWYDGMITQVNEPEAEEKAQDGDGDGEGVFQLEPTPKPAKTYAVQFDDGDFDDAIPQDQIKLWEDKRARKRRIVPQVVRAVADGETAEKNEIEASSTAPGLDNQCSAVESSVLDKELTAPAIAACETKATTSASTEVTGSPVIVGQDSIPQPAPESAPKKRRIIPTTVTPGP